MKFLFMKFVALLVVFGVSNAWAGRCIIRIDSCNNPRVDLTKELGLNGNKIHTNNVTCLAKAEELKDICNVKKPVTVYYKNNLGVIVQKAKLMTRSIILRHPEPPRIVERSCPGKACSSGFLCTSGKISNTASCGVNDSTDCFCSRGVWTVY